LNEQYVLSIDVGTTAIKVGLFSISGKLHRIATREQALVHLAGERIEQSPLAGWASIVSGVREVTTVIDPHSIRGIAVSNHRGTAIALDAQGKPLSEFVIWMDKRGLPYIDWLEQHIGSETYYNICGHPVVPYTGITKLLWFRDSSLWDTVSVIAPPITYFLSKLGCESLVCDVATGSFLFPNNIDLQTWSLPLSESTGFPMEKLPRLVHATDIVGELSEAAAEELGLVSGIPLIAGGGDGQCAGVGSGVISSGRVMVNIGTAAGVQAFMQVPLRDPTCTLNCAAHVVSNAWEMEGHTQASGAVFRWFRDTFGEQEFAFERAGGKSAYDLLAELAASTLPGADGLLFIPTFNGSSAPIVDLSARGALLGLTLAHKREHVIRALLEGVSMELRWMLDAMIALGVNVENIYLVGGGARSPIWNQIHANVLGVPVTTLHIADAAMVGAAMCAVIGIGAYANWNEAASRFVQVKAVIEPDYNTQEVYLSLYENYKNIFVKLKQSGIFQRTTPTASA